MPVGSTPPKPPDQRRRRNAPQPHLADRKLPAEGRKGRAPVPPVPLGAAGKKLWGVLWASPQATTWTKTDHRGVATRCQLEDVYQENPADMKVLGQIVVWEDRWGFNPKARAALHMWIEQEGGERAADREVSATVTDVRDRLRAVSS